MPSYSLFMPFFAAVAAQEDCSVGKGPPPENPPCAAAQDVVVAFDASLKDLIAGGDADLTVLLNTIVDAYAVENASPTSPKMALVAFRNEAEVIQDLTSDRTALLTAVANRAASSGNTCTFCGLEKAQEVLTASGRLTARKVILLIIDGEAVSF